MTAAGVRKYQWILAWRNCFASFCAAEAHAEGKEPHFPDLLQLVAQEYAQNTIGKKWKAVLKGKWNAYSISLLHPECNIKRRRDFTRLLISLCWKLSLLFLGLSLLTAEDLVWHKALPVPTCLDVFPNVFDLQGLYNSSAYSPSSTSFGAFSHPLLVSVQLCAHSEGSCSLQRSFWIVSHPHLLLKAEREALCINTV